jgi:heme exporter protein D
MAAFLAMGGYAQYVWPAYGLSALGIGALVVTTLRSYGRARARLAALETERGDKP